MPTATAVRGSDAGKSGMTNEPATPRTPPSAPQMTGSHLLSSFVALTACAASAQIRMQVLDSLLCQEILLAVLDLRGIVQRVAHVPIAMGVGNALDGLRGRFSERDGGVDALDERHIQFLSRPFDLRAFVLPPVDAPPEQPEAEARNRRRDAEERGKLYDVDVHMPPPTGTAS